MQRQSRSSIYLSSHNATTNPSRNACPIALRSRSLAIVFNSILSSDSLTRPLCHAINGHSLDFLELIYIAEKRPCQFSWTGELG